MDCEEKYIFPVAKYAEPGVPEYGGNPLIEALPPILDAASAYKMILNLPAFSAQERDLPNEVRSHLVYRLTEWVEPRPDHIAFEQIFSRLIRRGYMVRNPTRPATRQMWHFLKMRGKDGIPMPAQSFGSTNTAFCVVGPSGTGKTTLLNSILRSVPQVIAHTEYQGKPYAQTQIVWLKVDCPYDGSLKGLCFAFFSAVDRLIGTDYYIQNSRGRLSIDAMLQNMEQVAATFCLGVLVIDELQNLAAAKAGGGLSMMRFFNSLINNVGLPIVLVGTYAAVSLFSGAIKDARRVTNQGMYDFKRLAKDQVEWKLLLKRLFKYQWIRKPVAFSDTLGDALYEYSQGITDILVKLFMLAQWRAIGTSETLNKELFKAVSEDELSILEPALGALRSGRRDMMRAFDDLLPPPDRLKALFRRKSEAHSEQEVLQLVREMAESNPVNAETQPVQENLVSILKQHGVSEDQIAKIEEFLSGRPHHSGPDLPLQPDDLRNCVGADNPHDYLCGIGAVAKDVWVE